MLNMQKAPNCLKARQKHVFAVRHFGLIWELVCEVASPSCRFRTPRSPATSHEQCCEGLLQLIASKLPVKKRDLVCEVFSSPHCCHVPSSHCWDPPHCVLYPDGISPVLQETAKVSGWRDGCGSGVVAGEGEGSHPPQWAYCQLESGKAKPPMVSVSPMYTARVCTKSYTYTTNAVATCVKIAPIVQQLA